MVRPEIRPILADTKVILSPQIAVMSVSPPFPQPFLVITEGRYPCKAKTQSGEFISNSVMLGPCPASASSSDKPVMLLTGPNMGGKSTLMRQTALIIILAQLVTQCPATATPDRLSQGCNVPAEGPVIMTPVDRLFTRQGANDSIGSGQSTLQVEMTETSLILAYMTEHSFLLIDELGRGTATHDGCALACGILKGIAEDLGPRTIFSTHFHKLLEEPDVVASTQICHMVSSVSLLISLGYRVYR